MAFFAVCDDDIFDGDGHVVAEDLPEDALVEAFGHCFAFDEHPGLGGFVEDEEVEAFVELTELHAAFDGYVGRGVVFDEKEVLNEVLSDPFFRGESNPLFA